MQTSCYALGGPLEFIYVVLTGYLGNLSEDRHRERNPGEKQQNQDHLAECRVIEFAVERKRALGQEQGRPSRNGMTRSTLNPEAANVAVIAIAYDAISIDVSWHQDV